MRLVQKVALLFGIVFVLIAILGFFATGMSMNADMATAPRLLGLFPVNAAHNGVHLGFGIWGLLAAKSYVSARRYCQFSGGVYLLLAALGLVIPETFGFVPIGGNDIALHAVLGLVLTIVGFSSADRPETATTTTAR
jgi:hypothetical protein